jgi:hypothetical protein
MNDSGPVQHLLTKYVFIDTEAFRKARFDWIGKTLTRLVELARQGHLHLLTTEVTKREITSQLREAFAEAVESLKKHEIILQQVGAAEALTAIADENTAIPALDAAFEKFLKDAKAIDVPLSADLSALFDGYFARRPPFSAKKKSEFPDAVTIASLLAWCEKRHATAYVVSADPDLKACCSPSGPLFYAASAGDIISQATVSKELHEALEKALCVLAVTLSGATMWTGMLHIRPWHQAHRRCCLRSRNGRGGFAVRLRPDLPTGSSRGLCGPRAS